VNIYVTSVSAFESARNLDDKTLTLALLDAVQLLSATAVAKKKTGLAYPPADLNDPSVRWLVNDMNNVWWMIAYTSAMRAEYNDRFQRRHAAEDILLSSINAFGYETAQVKMFQNRAEGFLHVQDVPTAYKLFLDKRWSAGKHPPKWTRSRAPEWYPV
jgi:hypothetical protein